MKKLILQIIKFGFVGAVATVIDMGLLVLLKEVLHVDVLLASAIAFSASVIANYLLSMRFVFKGKEQNKIKEFVIFVALSVGGLLINEAVMWVGVNYLTSLHYIVVKLFAMVIVPVYNFVTRKIFLEKKATSD